MNLAQSITEVKREEHESFQKEAEGKKTFPNHEISINTKHMPYALSTNRILQNGAVKEKTYMLYRRNINSITH